MLLFLLYILQPIMYVANWSVLITHWLTQNNCDSPVLELYSPSDIAVHKAGLKYASLSLTACPCTVCIKEMKAFWPVGNKIVIMKGGGALFW